jgi:hypothetical protein
MALLIKGEAASETVSPTPFVDENQLQSLLSEHPALLQQENEPSIALIAREVDLKEAGWLDLLMVNRDGLPIAVEVKLARNGESRREVVAQAIDYISALTSMTVDELDDLLDNRVEKALRAFDEGDEEGFERRWHTLGANLRAGLVRLLVAVDGSNPGLERILRFLAEKSELDVQLIVTERFIGSSNQEVLVSRPTFSAESVSRGRGPHDRKSPRSELVTAVERYNAIAKPDLQAVGIATNYRQVRPKVWPSAARTHYEFYQTSTYIGAELHIESDAARPLSEILAPLAGTMAQGSSLIWDQAWSSGRGRLTIRFSLGEDPSKVAQAMRELIEFTYPDVTQRLAQLFSPPTLVSQSA